MSSPLAPAQLKARLWADDAQQVYALPMGSRIPGLRERLAAAPPSELVEWDCLVPGALPAAEAARAPYLVQLRRESPLTDWLLFEAAAALGDWGLIGLAPQPRLVMRSHWRGLLKARQPDGAEIDLEWMDPAVLTRLLPLFDPSGLYGFMGPATALVVPGVQTWSTARVQMGQLDWQQTGVLKS